MNFNPDKFTFLNEFSKSAHFSPLNEITTEKAAPSSDTSFKCDSNCPTGCLYCYKNDELQCAECDTSLHINKNPKKRKCNCEKEYKLSER